MDSGGEDGGGDPTPAATMSESSGPPPRAKPPSRAKPTVISSRPPPSRPAQPASPTEPDAGGPGRPPPAAGRPGRPPARPSSTVISGDSSPKPPQPKGRPAPPPSRPIPASRISQSDLGDAGHDDGGSEEAAAADAPPTPTRSAASAEAVTSRKTTGEGTVFSAEAVTSRKTGDGPATPASRPAAPPASKPAKPGPPGAKGRPPPPRPKSFAAEDNSPPLPRAESPPASGGSEPDPARSAVASAKPAPPGRPTPAASKPAKPAAAPGKAAGPPKPAAPPAKPAAPPGKPTAPPSRPPAAAAKSPPPQGSVESDVPAAAAAARVPGRPPPAAGKPPKPKPAAGMPSEGAKPGRPPAAAGPPKPGPPKSPMTYAPPEEEELGESSNRVVPGEEGPRESEPAPAPKPARPTPAVAMSKPKPPKPVSPTPKPMPGTPETSQDRIIPGEEAVRKDDSPSMAKPAKPKPAKPGLPTPAKRHVDVEDVRQVTGQEEPTAQSPPAVSKSLPAPAREEEEPAIEDPEPEISAEPEGFLAEEPFAPEPEDMNVEHSPPAGRPSKPPARRPSAGPSKPPGSARPPPPKAGPSGGKPPPPTAGPRRSSSTRTERTPPKTRRAAAAAELEEPPPTLPPRPPPGHPLFKYVVKEAHGICTASYNATEIDDLSMEIGDVIVILDRIDDHWLQGRNVENEGMFPQRAIRIVKKLASDVKMASGPSCVGRFDFVGESEDELCFKKGDLIELLAREGSDWLKGKLEGSVGVFPADYVEILEDFPEGYEPPQEEEEEEEEDPDSYDRPCCRATFDFDGQDDAELSFKKDDLINIVSRVDADWLKGELNGKEGLFPEAFAIVLKDIAVGETFDPSSAAEKKTEKPTAAAEAKAESDAPKRDPYCIALFDYKAEAGDEISFLTGDEIFLLRRIDAQWMEGVHVNTTGIFPADFVEIKVDLPEHEEVVKLSNNISAENDLSPRVEALFDFEAENDDELSFKTGDTIFLLDREGTDWYLGELGGKFGKFPNNFAKVIVDLP